MAQGVCWVARELGVPATVVAPDHAPRAKLDAIERLGGRVIAVPFETWWETMETGSYPGLDGLFVHPVLDERVMAGNGVIGLELAEQLDGIDAVLVPWGGGGLTTGIASALAAAVARDPRDRLRARDGRAAGRVASRPASRSRSTTGRRSSTAPARRRCSPRCGSARGRWSRTRSPCRSTRPRQRCACSPPARTSSPRGRARLPLAAALAGHGGTGRVVCIVSGGNIDPDRLATILAGETPAYPGGSYGASSCGEPSRRRRASPIRAGCRSRCATTARRRRRSRRGSRRSARRPLGTERLVVGASRGRSCPSCGASRAAEIACGLADGRVRPGIDADHVVRLRLGTAEPGSCLAPLRSADTTSVGAMPPPTSVCAAGERVLRPRERDHGVGALRQRVVVAARRNSGMPTTYASPSTTAQAITNASHRGKRDRWIGRPRR